MNRSESERGRPACRIADEMEPRETMQVRHPQNTCDLRAETVARWRLLGGVHLEIFCDRVDSLPEYPEQRGIRRLGRQHDAGQQHDGMSSRHTATLPSVLRPAGSV